MDTLRKRNPFKFTESNPEGLFEDRQVLDEQQQDEILQQLRAENAESDKSYTLLLNGIIILSALLHLVYLFDPSERNPFQALLSTSSPSDIGSELSIPLPRAFTLVSLTLHLNLALLLNPSLVEAYLRPLGIVIELYPLPYRLSYALAAVAPTICVYLGRSWLTLVWWSLTGALIYTIQTTQESISRGKESISALEAMKYAAPGA